MVPKYLPSLLYLSISFLFEITAKYAINVLVTKLYRVDHDKIFSSFLYFAVKVMVIGIFN